MIRHWCDIEKKTCEKKMKADEFFFKCQKTSNWNGKHVKNYIKTRNVMKKVEKPSDLRWKVDGK